MSLLQYTNGTVTASIQNYLTENEISDNEMYLVEIMDENISTQETVSYVIDLCKESYKGNKYIIPMFRPGLHRLTARNANETSEIGKGPVIDRAYCVKNPANPYYVTVELTPSGNYTLMSVSSDVFIPAGEVLSYKYKNYTYYLPEHKHNNPDQYKGIPANVKCYYTLPSHIGIEDLIFERNPAYIVPEFDDDGIKPQIFSGNGSRLMALCINVNVVR